MVVRTVYCTNIDKQVLVILLFMRELSFIKNTQGAFEYVV